MKTQNEVLQALVSAAQALLKNASDRDEVTDLETGEVHDDWGELITALNEAKEKVTHVTNDEVEKRGIAIGNLLRLRQKKGDYVGYRCYTTWGTKTAVGLYRTLGRWFEPVLDGTCKREIRKLRED